jgi:hypothetical protein
LQESDSGQWRVACSLMQTALWGQMQSGAEGPGGSITPADELRVPSKLPKATWQFSAPVSEATVRTLERVWAAVIAGAREPREPSRCIDGTSYYVFQRRQSRDNMGALSRCARSGTPAALLLQLVEGLRRHAGSSGTALVKSDILLAKQATELLRALE